MADEGDEFVNDAERRAWLRGHTVWQERPFESRLIGFRSGRFNSGGWHAANAAQWTNMYSGRDDTVVHFTKLRADTDLWFRGHIGVWAVGRTVAVAVSAPGGPGTTDGWPPHDDQVAGMAAFQGEYGDYHQSIPINFLMKLSGTGAKQAHLQCMGNTAPVSQDQHDHWAIQVWEVAPRG